MKVDIWFQVGSGGVGKSALTLQYMYDEVSNWNVVFDFFRNFYKKII